MATEFYELSVQGVLQNSYRENVLTFRGTGLTADDTFTNGTSLKDGWIATLQALWLAVNTPDYQIMQLQARRISSSPSAVAKEQYQLNDQPGTRGSQSTSQNLAPVVFLIPPMGVKSGGKIFMPSVDIADVVQNVYSAGYLTASNAFMTAATTPFSSSGITWQLAIWSRRLAVGNLVMSWTHSSRIGFQGRRRVPGGGL